MSTLFRNDILGNFFKMSYLNI
ncbi:MAG: hypothetical protein ACD_7C00270G0009, partial [uncultured bacterium]